MNSLTHTETFRLNQPVEIVFPLFSAEGEKRWAPGWDYQPLSGTDCTQEDFIFLTKSHDHASSKEDTIWIVKCYDPEAFLVQYYRVEPGVKVGLVTVRCLEVEEGVTDVEVTYHYTALSDRGRTFLEGFTAAHYQEFIAGWKTHLNHYFQSK